MEYYKNVISKIEKLYDKEPLKALLLITEELSVPYIPQEYEQKFKEIGAKIANKINQKHKSTILSKEGVFEVLSTPKHPLLAVALNQIKDLNLASAIKEIETFFLNKKIPQIPKAIVYEYLVQQNINHKFILNRKMVNPMIEGSISANPDFLKTLDEINKITEKNPSLQKIAVMNFENFALKSFPPVLSYQKTDVKIFIALAHEMLGIKSEFSFTTEEEKRKRNINEIITNFN